MTNVVVQILFDPNIHKRDVDDVCNVRVQDFIVQTFNSPRMCVLDFLMNNFLLLNYIQLESTFN
jgi:hypothetical protein